MTRIDRSSPMPLWAQLLDVLRERIDAGELTDSFPTDAELIDEYGLSRHTVREAVRRLQDEGLLTRERGRGTFVRTPPIEQPTGAIYSLFRSIEAQGRQQLSKVLDLSETTDPAVALRLDLAPDEPLVRIERLRCADDQILAHDTAWLPATVSRPLLDIDFAHTGLYDQLASRCGIRPTSGSEWIHTALPSPAERELLGVGARQPVFTIQRLSNADGRPIEWRETVVRGDGYTFVSHWSPADAYSTALVPTDVETA